MENSKTASLIRELAQESAIENGLELVHVEIVGKPGGRTVRVFIDKAGGIGHEDCVAVSQSLDRKMESDDPVDGAYTLEVSSPGIERGLYSLGDFKRFAGERARIKTHTPLNGQRNFKGNIVGVDGDSIVFEDVTNGNVQIDFDLVRKANLEFDFDNELKNKRSRKRG